MRRASSDGSTPPLQTNPIWEEFGVVWLRHRSRSHSIPSNGFLRGALLLSSAEALRACSRAQHIQALAP